MSRVLTCAVACCSLLLALTSAAVASDNFHFAPPVRYPAGTQTARVTVADLNGDGKLDIVAASTVDQKVYVLLGNGDGTFQPAVGYATANASPMGVVVADFTGDGIPDIAVVTAAMGGSYAAYMVLPGAGDGTFGAPIVTQTSAVSPTHVKAYDFNGDGKIDLLVQGNGTTVIALSNGDGTFQTIQFIPAVIPGVNGVGYESSVAADLTKSGLLDVVVGTYQGLNSPPPEYACVYTASSSATYGAPSCFAAVNGAYGMMDSMAAADLNGDGYPDVLMGFSSGDFIGLLINNGDGTFQPVANYYGGTTPTSIVFADFNGDGKLDAGFSDYNSNPYVTPDNYGVSILSGSAAGLDQQSLIQFDIGNQASEIAVGDFNGDGLPDIVTADTKDNAVSVLLNGANMSLSLMSSQNPSLPSQSTTLSVHVQPVSGSGPVPTGTVTFTQGTTTLGTATLDASANASITATFSSVTPGNYVRITALYSGDSKYVGTSDSLYQGVGYPVTVAETASPLTVAPGGTTTLTATTTALRQVPSPSMKDRFYSVKPLSLRERLLTLPPRWRPVPM